LRQIRIKKKAIHHVLKRTCFLARFQKKRIIESVMIKTFFTNVIEGRS